MRTKSFSTDRHGDEILVALFPEHEGHVQLVVDAGGTSFRVALNHADAVALHAALSALLGVAEDRAQAQPVAEAA